MKKTLISAFTTGLFTSFIISFFHVQYSNGKLSILVKELALQGHNIIVPNRYILESFNTVIPAFCGSVFFVLTAGVAITAFSLIMILLFSILCKEKNSILRFYMGFWILITIILNAISFSIVLTAYTIIIPFCVILLFLPRLSPITNIKKNTMIATLVFIFSFTAVSSVFYNKTDNTIFLRARDYLLLSNKPGQIINNFYYKYSPYAANALNGPQPELLTSNQMLPDSPQNYNTNLKFVCFSGIVLIWPALLYLLLFYSTYIILSKFINAKKMYFFTGIISLSIYALLLFYFAPFNIDQNKVQIKNMLFSETQKTRIEVLRIIYNKKIDIWNYPDSVKYFSNGTIPEKYWLANVLSLNKNLKNIYYLKMMAEDKSINVQCTAIRALSLIGCNEEFLQIFKNKIKFSRFWYVQQSAYNAYKRCE